MPSVGEVRLLRPEWIVVLTLISVGFWFYELASFPISIDDETTAVRSNPAIFIAHGRWTIYLVEAFVFPQPTVPFLPVALFCLSTVASYILVLRSHRLPLDVAAVAFFPLFAAYPTWNSIAEFYPNIPSVALGLLLCSVAAHSLSRSQERDQQGAWRRIVVQIACVSTAIGTYQSFVCLFIAMVIGVALSEYRVRCDIRRCAQILVYGAMITIASAATYYVIAKAFQMGLGIQMKYVNQFYDLEALARPLDVISSTVWHAMRVYSGTPAIYAVPLYAVAATMLLGAATFALSFPTWQGKAIVLFLLGTLLLSPFALSLVSGGGWTLPIRSLVAVPYAVWFAAFGANHIMMRPVKWLLLAILGAGLLQVAYAHAIFNARSELGLERDRLIASQIYERVVQKIPDFDRTAKYKIDFYGSLSSELPYPAVAGTAGQSFFTWDGGNPSRIVSFMRLLGMTSFATVSRDEGRALVPLYQSMPVWPAHGSVRVTEDGVIAVRLGKAPGPRHRARRGTAEAE